MWKITSVQMGGNGIYVAHALPGSVLSSQNIYNLVIINKKSDGILAPCAGDAANAYLLNNI